MKSAISQGMSEVGGFAKPWTMIGVTVCKFAVLAYLATVSVLADAAPKTMAVGTGYLSYAGYDYIPQDGSDEVAVDLEGVAAVSAEACAEACEVTPGCNGASFYPDPESTFGNAGMKNCWMKTFSYTCEMPVDSVMEELAALLMKPDASCFDSDYDYQVSNPTGSDATPAPVPATGGPAGQATAQAAEAPTDLPNPDRGGGDDGEDTNDGPNVGAIAGGVGGAACVLAATLVAFRARAAAKHKQMGNEAKAPDHQKYPEAPAKESYPSKNDEYPSKDQYQSKDKYPTKEQYPSKGDLMPSKNDSMPSKY